MAAGDNARVLPSYTWLVLAKYNFSVILSQKTFAVLSNNLWDYWMGNVTNCFSNSFARHTTAPEEVFFFLLLSSLRSSTPRLPCYRFHSTDYFVADANVVKYGKEVFLQGKSYFLYLSNNFSNYIVRFVSRKVFLRLLLKRFAIRTAVSQYDIA